PLCRQHRRPPGRRSEPPAEHPSPRAHGRAGPRPAARIRRRATPRAMSIELIGVTKTYRIGTIEVGALRGVSLEIAAGELVAIMGPSGSGKSTLMNILGCLDVPTNGSYRLDGEEVARLKDDQLAKIRSRKIGFVF